MSTYLRLLGYLKPYRTHLFMAIGCMVLYAGMSAMSLGMIAPFVKVLFERPEATPTATIDGAGNSAARAPSGDQRAERLIGWPDPLRTWANEALIEVTPLVALERICLLILVILLLKNLADYLQAYLMVAVEQAAIRDLRSGVYAHLHTLPLSFFDARRTGMLVSRITNDVEFLRASLAAGISNLIKDGLTLIGYLTWVFLASWKLALFSIVILPPAAWALVIIGRKMRKRSTLAQERMADLTSILQETIVGARVVKAFGMERFESRKFDEANQKYFSAFVHLRRVSAAARPLSEYMIILVAVTMLWFGGREIFINRTLEPQQFILFVTALLATIGPIKGLSDVNTNVQQGISAGRRIFSVLDTPPAIRDRDGARALLDLKHGIRYQNVSFAYQPGVPVLKDISLEIERGEVVALVGSSGAGKSTTMDLLARFHEPTSGCITVDGVDIRDATLRSLRGQFGIVTQETILFHDTVRNNIAYGRPDASDAEIETAARAAHAHDWITAMPHGYDTVVGERGAKISGGERQRLAIARALLKNPPILLLDEATSSLDMESEHLVQKALERLMEGRTVLVIAHRLSTVQRAHKIVVLEHGRVVACGTHAELIEQDGLYRRLYDLQFVARPTYS